MSHPKLFYKGKIPFLPLFDEDVKNLRFFTSSSKRALFPLFFAGDDRKICDFSIIASKKRGDFSP